VSDTICRLYLELSQVVPDGTKTERELGLEARVAELEVERDELTKRSVLLEEIEHMFDAFGNDLIGDIRDAKNADEEKDGILSDLYTVREEARKEGLLYCRAKSQMRAARDERDELRVQLGRANEQIESYRKTGLAQHRATKPDTRIKSPSWEAVSENIRSTGEDPEALVDAAADNVDTWRSEATNPRPMAEAPRGRHIRGVFDIMVDSDGVVEILDGECQGWLPLPEGQKDSKR
jgi:hypothetical protein